MMTVTKETVDARTEETKTRDTRTVRVVEIAKSALGPVHARTEGIVGGSGWY